MYIVLKHFSILSLWTISFLSCISRKKEEVTTILKKPNIIFIMADDHATQAISAYGHPISQLAPTPNIDKIASEGVLFRNNFCANSTCGPSFAILYTVRCF